MSQVPAKCCYSAAVCDHLQQQQQHASPLCTAEECGLRNVRFEDSDPHQFLSFADGRLYKHGGKFEVTDSSAIGVSGSEKVEATFGDKQHVRGCAKNYPARTQAASASVNGRTGVLYARKIDQNAQN